MSSEPERSTPAAHVPALDGLRGIAVLLVVAYHLEIPPFQGGFLGVDLFFVLSGFLITQLLLREFKATGRVSLVQFWLRRARRLLPALFLLVAVVAATAPLLAPLARMGLRGDLIAALAYVANWHYVFQGQSYFVETAGPSLLRHLWSLAIEEQFYLLWPLCAWAALALVRRAGRGGRLVVAAAWTAAVAASLAALMAFYDAVDPSRAYFGTDARVHELLLGAALPALLHLHGRCPWSGEGPRAGKTRAAVGFAALGVVLALAVLVEDTAGIYYFGGSLLFSAACLLAIGTATLPSGAWTSFLSSRLLVATGKVSYGMYLWHWPFVVWLSPATTGLTGVPLGLARFVATVAVTVASYFVIERPIRRGRLGRLRLGPRVVFPAALVIALALAGLSLLTTRTTIDGRNFDVKDMRVRYDVADRSAPALALVGDSVARSLYKGLAREAQARGWSSAGAVYGGCSVGDLMHVDIDGRPFKFSDLCRLEVPVRQAELVSRLDPDVVLWYSGRDRYDLLVDGRHLVAGSPEWKEEKFGDWDRTLARLSQGGARVVLIPPVWGPLVPLRCEQPTGQPADCSFAGYLNNEQMRGFYREWAKGRPGRVEVVDMAAIECPDGPPCPQIVDGIDVRDDSVHFSEAGAEWIAPKILDRIPGLGPRSR